MFSGARSAQSQMSPSKSRTKLEALDTLVISTIHNVSNKLCSTSATLLRQAASVFPEQDEEQVNCKSVNTKLVKCKLCISLGFNTGDGGIFARRH